MARATKRTRASSSARTPKTKRARSNGLARAGRRVSSAKLANTSARRLRVLVTAGPTREHVDPVRYLTNESSGKMGFAIAEAAARAGHEVTLIAGPVSLPTPRGVTRIDIVSARELLEACRRDFRRCDALVMAAAVADWRPAKKLAAKWRAKDSGAERTTLELARNPDVLASLTGGRRVPGKTVIAFALETGSGVARARRKLAKKGADWIVLNGPASLGGERTSVLLLGADGEHVGLRDRSKAHVAQALIERLKPACAGMGAIARARRLGPFPKAAHPSAHSTRIGVTPSVRPRLNRL